MLEKFLVLLERFVVAHELLAANSDKKFAEEIVGKIATIVDEPQAGEQLKGAGADDLPPCKKNDEVLEEKPKRQPRQTKPKEEPKGHDLGALREDIKTIAKAIAAGDSDECADLFDELLEDFSVRTVTKLPDADVEAFHKAAKKLVAKFYEIED